MHDQFKIDFNEEKINSDESVVKALKYISYLSSGKQNGLLLHL